MPEITRFYGIIIKLFFADYPPAHFHAIYGEYEIWTNGQHCSQNLEP